MVEAAIAIEDFDNGVIDAVFKTQKEVEVAEADIGINGDNGEAEAGEGETYIGGGGGFSDTAFAGCDDHHAWGLAG